jgi:hypothetical protein
VCQLKKQFINKVAMNLIIFITLVVGYFSVMGKFDEEIIKNEATIIELGRVDIELAKLKRENHNLVEARKLLSRLNKRNYSDAGLEIVKLKSVLRVLSQTYNLPGSIDIQMSNIVEHDDIYVRKNKALVSAELIITFPAYSDEHVLGLITSLKEYFPGFLTIRTLTITKNKELDKTTLEDIRNNKLPEVVTAKILVDWYDFKTIE